MNEKRLIDFWNRVKIGDGCWEWQGKPDDKGYGRFRPDWKGRQRKAHAVAYELLVGEIPKDKPCLLHKCDNRICVRPSHLYPGTLSDNHADMVAKGRQRGAKGDAHGWKKHPESVPRGDQHYMRKRALARLAQEDK